MGQSEDWPQFRGESADGVAVSEAKLPETWDVEQRQNVAWKAPLPGMGPSSPIVSGGKVFVTGSGGREQSELYVIAFDAETGQQIWKRTLYATGRTLTHATSANAAPTPATDGQHVVAFYSSNDLVCLDVNGNLKWFRGLASDYPKLGNDIGMASSPLIVDDVVIVQAESQGDSMALGIDLKTGENLWKVNRPREGNWTTPTLLRLSDSTEPLILLQSLNHISAHEVKTGVRLWQHDAESGGIASPLAVGNRVYIAAEGLTSLNADSEGTSVAWQSSKLSPGASSPIFQHGKVYTVNRAGILSCASATDGKLLWKLRLGIGRQWATPAIAGERMYCFDTDGQAAIVDLSGDSGSVLANLELGEPIKASPAIANGAIFVRSDEHLWKLSHRGS